MRLSACIRRLALVLPLVVPVITPAVDWASAYRAWNDRNEWRCYGSANSAELAWFESHLLQGYLSMFAATGDTSWLDRFVLHADTMLALSRDCPDSGDFWPGYHDGFRGWGTTRYDPDGRYQEYLVHDAHICLPVARFAKLVFATPGLQPRFLARALRYLNHIEQHIVTKWYQNWYSDRGTGEALSNFGGWRSLPLNQSLVFGELLLTIHDLVNSPIYRETGSQGCLAPRSFYSATADSMARLFRRNLLLHPEPNAYTWSYWPGSSPSPRPEDIAHANLDISFAIVEHTYSGHFSNNDLVRFGNTLTAVMWDGVTDNPGLSRYVNGDGPLDTTGCLAGWLRLAQHQPDCYWLIRAFMLAVPNRLSPYSHSSVALVIATLAELQPLFPDDVNRLPCRRFGPSISPVRQQIAPTTCRSSNAQSSAMLLLDASPITDQRLFDPAGRVVTARNSSGIRFFIPAPGTARQRLIIAR